MFSYSNAGSPIKCYFLFITEHALGTLQSTTLLPSQSKHRSKHQKISSSEKLEGKFHIQVFILFECSVGICFPEQPKFNALKVDIYPLNPYWVLVSFCCYVVAVWLWAAAVLPYQLRPS